jgi:hypothetical protein
MTTIDQREEARYRQEVLLSYRAWLIYLEAQQHLVALAADAYGTADPFEGRTQAQERAEAARQRLAALSADKRELFDAVYDQERQQIQRQLDAEAPTRGGTVKRADPEEVARRALTRLLEEARGLHRDDRRGLVPRGKPDAVKWLALDLTEVTQAPPSEADYQLAGGRSKGRRSVIMNIIFAVLALVGIPLLLLLLQKPGQQAASLGRPMSNDAALLLWPIVAVGHSEGGPLLPIREVTSRWPADCGQATEQACWLANSLRPLRLCLPARQLTDYQAMRIETGSDAPARIYDLTREVTSSPDVVVTPCDEASPDSSTRYGYLIALEELIALAPGDAAAPEGFALASITAIGRGERPDLREGRMVVSVVIEDADEARDWGALAPRLLLADGSLALPSDSRREGQTVQLDYHTAEQLEPFDVMWQVAGADQVVRYRATLEPPPDRDAVLRARLQVENLAVTPSQQTMAVRLTLHNAATSPLVVEEADLGFQTNATRREVAAPTLQQPLAPGERRAVTFSLPLESGVLQLGPFRYELAVRR